MSKDDIAVVVDDQDNVIGYKKSGNIVDERIRITAIWIENASGQVLIAQRHRSKRLHPLMWGPAVAGTVEKGESYLGNATKELFEELGVANVKLHEFSKQIYQYREVNGKRVCMWYRLILDWPIEKFTLQADEVEQIKWVDKVWLKDDLAQNPDHYVPSSRTWSNLFKL
jgi:isopentenyldiphosphate isomerase